METKVLLDRANLLLNQRRYKDAEMQVQQVLQQEPDNHYAMSVLARCFLNSKQHEKGIDLIHQAISIDPNNSFYFYLLGFGHYQKDRHMEAISNLEKAIALNPYVAAYFGLLAAVLIDEREFESALEKANEGLALEADNLTCLNARSTALNKLRRTSDAIETMQTALAHDPDNETTHSTVGWNLLERGKHKEAESHFMEALRLSPNFRSAKIGLKESLKSRIILYKWLLQYSFWISNKGKNLKWILPIGLYVVFKVLAKTAGSSGLTWFIGALYLLIVVTSWIIGSVANFVLLFHPVGKFALSYREKWSAINSVSSFLVGIVVMVLSNFVEGEEFGSKTLFIGMVILSMALPLAHIDYPIRLKGKNWRQVFGVCLVGLGILATIVFMLAPGMLNPLLVLYVVCFAVYNWSGLAS